MTLALSISSAQTQAQANWTRNQAALETSQPQLLQLLAEISLDVEWVFARDGSLSALEFDQWIGGCSLPRRAAQAMLAKLAVQGAVACFLDPSHAGHVSAALEMLRPEQAMIAIIPQAHNLAALLHCEDFSADLQSRRLWFAAGADWENILAKLFEDHPGLSTPAQFIRTPDAETQIIEPLISAAQKIFSRANSDRSIEMQTMRESVTVCVTTRLCAVIGSRFRLWNDIGHAMLSALKQTDLDIVQFDADDPALSSPLALLKAASPCNLIMTANTSRTDLPGLLPETIAWITWITGPRIPSGALASESDRIILADPAARESALKSGWRESQIHIAGWPAIACAQKPDQSSPTLSIIVDTFDLETPKDLIEYSSHGLLWESIRRELSADPFVLSDANDFLSRRMQKLNVGDENFPHQRFIEKLILPAYQQGLARTLIKANLPLRLHGSGWNDLDEFRSHAAGSITSREEFDRVISQSAVLVN
ncbi:MAG TPA: hypothetical protein VGF52_06770, partial [Tepidisphaeraceae bacterium]